MAPRFGLLVLSMSLIGCQRERPAVDSPPSPRGSGVVRAPAEPAAAKTALGSMLPDLDLLEVPGYEPAVFSTPPDKSQPRPLVVVAHGAGGRPEWHCELWSHIVGDRAFVLCPRGRRQDVRIPTEDATCYFPHHHYLRAVVEASIAALQNQASSPLDCAEAVYVGYSQGATMGALFLPTSPRFARALLVEGGFSEWNIPIALRFREHGGRRVALVCGTPRCAAGATQSASWLQQGGLVARAIHVAHAGHSSFGAMAERLPDVFRWLTENDPRFRPPRVAK